jgi:hypothetical protein
MPTPTAPTLYQSVTPLESYENLAEQLKRIQTETGKIQGQRYQEVGTPSELGARQAGRRVQEIGSYLSSLPVGDKYLQQTTGVTGQFQPAKEAAQENLTEAQKQYAEALKKTGEKPEPTIAETPSWAKKTVT